jgi:hypothetical protein
VLGAVSAGTLQVQMELLLVEVAEKRKFMREPNKVAFGGVTIVERFWQMRRSKQGSTTPPSSCFICPGLIQISYSIKPTTVSPTS